MANTTAGKQWKKELGALWKRQTKGTAEKYLTGTINLKDLGFEDKDIPLVIFSNKGKKKDEHPDLRIYLSEKRTQTSAPAAAPVPAPVDSSDLI